MGFIASCRNGLSYLEVLDGVYLAYRWCLGHVGYFHLCLVCLEEIKMDGISLSIIVVFVVVGVLGAIIYFSDADRDDDEDD